MSPSIRPTRCPALASAMARFEATVDFPTPPLPDEIAMTLPRFGSDSWAGGGGTALPASPGGPCVEAAGPDGSLIWILGSGRSATVNAWRIWRTSVAGSSRRSRKVKVGRPSSPMTRPSTIPAASKSVPVRGFVMLARAACAAESGVDATRWPPRS